MRQTEERNGLTTSLNLLQVSSTEHAIEEYGRKRSAAQASIRLTKLMASMMILIARQFFFYLDILLRLNINAYSKTM